jgi:hypothetical protein
MMRFSILTLLFFCLSAEAYEFKCPDKIETKQVLSGEIASGWQGVDDTLNGQKVLEGVNVYDGNPSNVGSSLAPDNKGSKQDPHWIVKPPNQLWVSCRYSQTSIRMVKAIPPELKKCKLKYKTSLGYATKKIADSLICK